MILVSSAFILHRQNYGESSRILRCMTRDFGRVDLLCKGCRAHGKRGRVLEPFRQYTLGWAGRGELKSLRQSDEVEVYPLSSSPEHLYCGFYINELLNQVIRPNEAEPELFDLYQGVLAGLTQKAGVALSLHLRLFEISLLQLMGYGISLDVERDGSTPIQPGLSYGYEPDHGLFQTQSQNQVLAQGDTIIALRTGNINDARHAKEAKYLMRFILGYYLPKSSIQSRQLFA